MQGVEASVKSLGLGDCTGMLKLILAVTKVTMTSFSLFGSLGEPGAYCNRL